MTFRHWVFISIIQVLFTFSTFSQAVIRTDNQKKPEQNKQKEQEKLAAEYLNTRQYDKAAEVYENLFNENPSQYYYTNYLFCLTEIQDYKSALRVIKKMSRDNPERPRYKVDEAYVMTLSGDPAKAKKLYDEAFENIVPDQNQITDLANAYYFRGQIDYAIRTYEKGAEILGRNPFHLQLANIYEINGNFAAMIDEYIAMATEDETQIITIQNRLQSTLSNDPDGEKNNAFRNELLKRVQKNPEKTFFSELLLWHSIQQKDFDVALIQAKSLDKRLREDGSRLLSLGDLALTNSDFDVAVESYQYVVLKGRENPNYLPGKIGLVNARYLKITGNYNYTNKDLLALEEEYEQILVEFGQNKYTIPVIRNLAHLQAFYLDKNENAIQILENSINMPDIPKDLRSICKTELADIYLFTGEVWEATLLYSQVDKDFKNDPIGYEAKFRNARLSYFIGEYEWAKAQLDVLKGATSKLIANDALALSLLIADNMDPDSTYTALRIYSRAEMLDFQHKHQIALQTLDSVQQIGLWHPLFDEVLYKKAEINMEMANFTEADTLYAQVYGFYPDDILGDDAMFKRAELNENQLKNPARAMELYSELMLKYPGSIFTIEARKRYRYLRGDVIN